MRNARHGFTLIEVMIAVVILAVGLSSLFTSEAGAVKIAQRARSTTLATLLARCKMGEVEEKVAKEGWPGDVIEGRDECCEGAEQDGFTCEWKVELVKLPEPDVEDGPGLEGADKDKVKGAAEGALAGASGAGGAAGAAAGALSGASGPLSRINTSGDGGISSILDSVMTSAGESEGSDPLAGFVMELTFPIMKPVIEEGVRRATVVVNWKEGSREQSFDVVQYLVNEKPMLPDEGTTQNILEGQAAPGQQPPTPGSPNPTPSPAPPSNPR